MGASCSRSWAISQGIWLLGSFPHWHWKKCEAHCWGILKPRIWLNQLHLVPKTRLIALKNITCFLTCVNLTSILPQDQWHHSPFPQSVHVGSTNSQTLNSHGFLWVTPSIHDTGWWFGTWISFFHSVGNNHPSWRTHIFLRGIVNHQPGHVVQIWGKQDLPRKCLMPSLPGKLASRLKAVTGPVREQRVREAFDMWPAQHGETHVACDCDGQH